MRRIPCQARNFTPRSGKPPAFDMQKNTDKTNFLSAASRRRNSFTH
jgi:hypothetical protein